MSACWDDFYFMVEKISNGFFESKRRSTINSFSSLLGRSIILVSLKGKRSSLPKSSSWNTLRSAGKNNWKNPANQEAAGRLSALKRLLIGPNGFVKQTNRIFFATKPPSVQWWENCFLHFSRTKILISATFLQSVKQQNSCCTEKIHHDLS